MGLYRVVLTSTRAPAPLRFQFSGDIKRHALDGRVGFFSPRLSLLSGASVEGLARIRARVPREHMHVLRQGRRTAKGISGEARMNLYRRTSSSKFS